MPRFLIQNEEELDAALVRANELLGFASDSPEQSEMEEIADAIDAYAASVRIQSLSINDNSPSQEGPDLGDKS